MAKQHRKSQKSHRKSQKSHRKSQKSHKSQKSQKRQYRKQHGGGSCSAMPLNRESFQQQRGGMAPISTTDAYLLDAPTRVQAEVGPLDAAFAQLPSVIPKQAGGRRQNRKSRKSSKSRKSRKSRKQRGGMSAFDAPYLLLPQGAMRGVNPQFSDEGAVNSLYREYAGPQA